MRIGPSGKVAPYANIRVGVAGFAGLEISPCFCGMIERPVINLCGAGRAVGFDTQPAFVHRLVVAVLAEFRLMATFAALRIIHGLYGVGGNEIRPVAPGHVLPSARYPPLQIRFDGPAFVAVEAEGLLMAIRAIVPRLIRQQAMLFDKKRPVIVDHAHSVVAIPAFLKLGVSVFPMVGLGEGKTDDDEEKGGGQQDDFKRPMF